MKSFVVALVLIGVLSVSVLGGDMHGTDNPAPPGPSPTPQGIRTERTMSALSAPGDVHTGDSTQPTLEDALSTLLSVFGLVF